MVKKNSIMCNIIDSEVVLKSYFNKYPSRKMVLYSRLKEIRCNAEPHIHNVYIDISYSSLRAVKLAYPESIGMDNTRVRIIGKGFKTSKIAQTTTYLKLEPYL